MALVALKDLLEDAVRNRYAVGGFDAGEHGFAEAIIQAAEETQAPVILMVPEPFLKYVDRHWLDWGWVLFLILLVSGNNM